MKANNGTGNVEERDNWRTPQSFWNKLNNQYKFDWDLCADNTNNKTPRYFNNFEELKTTFENICWMNPPFSKANDMFRHFFKVVSKGVAIYRIDNIETNLWYKILKSADWVFILKGRLNYEGKVGKGARFGSALIGVGVPKPKEIEGVCLQEL